MGELVGPFDGISFFLIQIWGYSYCKNWLFTILPPFISMYKQARLTKKTGL